MQTNKIDYITYRLAHETFGVKDRFEDFILNNNERE